MSNLQQRLKAAVADIQARDAELAVELRDIGPVAAERMTRTINESAVEGGAGQPQIQAGADRAGNDRAADRPAGAGGIER